MLTLADILEALTNLRPPWADNLVITEADIDSRQVIPGSMFVALPGERVDGHNFIDDAFKHGASFAVIQRQDASSISILDLRDLEDSRRLLTQFAAPFDINQPFCVLVDNALNALQKAAHFWRRKLNVRVIGITGSVGKSTTKELVAEVLSQRYRTLKSPGSYNNEIGLPLTILSLTEGHERAVLEMGFYVPGEISFLCDLALPQVGVLTNIGTVHAERAGSIEAIIAGKTELVQALPASPEGVAVLNYDDPYVREMAGSTKAQVFTYGLDPDADLWADNVEGFGLEGIRFQLHYQGEVLHLRVPLIGRHSVHTALRAASVGLVEGLTWQEIVRGLRSGSTQLRLVAVKADSGAVILDDTYNASPQSTLAALNLLDELEGHKIAVLGDMLELGPYEEQGHEIVGLRAAEVVDVLVCVGPRARMIGSAARKAGFPQDSIVHFEETLQTVSYLKTLLTTGDVVLIKGSRGMAMDRIVASLESSK